MQHLKSLKVKYELKHGFAAICINLPHERTTYFHFPEYLPAWVFRFLDVLYSFTCLQIVIRHTVETPVDHAVSSHSPTTIWFITIVYMETRQDHGAVPLTTTTRTDIGAIANPEVSWAPYVSSILEQKESFDTRKREVWRYDTMMTKFLELNNLTWQRRPFALSKWWKKSMGYHFVPECNQAQESHKYQFLPFLFPAIFNGPKFVEIQKFC